MPVDFKKEWMEKSAIDYFSPFISLWLACNSWYMSHYSDLNDNHSKSNGATDRDFINKLKKDTTGRNHIYSKFAETILNTGKEGIAFRTDIELLHYALDRANLRPERISSCSFRSAVVDYSDKGNPVDLLRNPRIKQDGTVHASDVDSVIALDKIFLINDLQKCFAGILEITYQVRNMLVHGKLNPNKETHDVVKYCYRILWELMQ